MKKCKGERERDPPPQKKQSPKIITELLSFKSDIHILKNPKENMTTVKQEDRVHCLSGVKSSLFPRTIHKQLYRNVGHEN